MPAWGCTIDKYMWIEKGKEERGRKVGGRGQGGSQQHLVGNEEMKFLLPDPLPTNWVVEIM